jgi:O-antigen/teichoic acid export membrane protein
LSTPPSSTLPNGVESSGEAQAATPQPEGLRRSAAEGARWSFVAFAGKQVIRMLFGLGLARVLGPDDYGVVAQALVFLTFLALFLDQGLGATVIQRQDLTDRLLATAFVLSIAVSVALAGLTVAGAPLLGDFFHTPAVTDVLRVLAVSVLLQGLAVVPQAVLTRHLRMKGIALREVASALFGGAVGVVVALEGGGYWALVVQSITTDAVVLLVTMMMVGSMPIRGALSDLREIWAFSSKVFGIQFLAYLSRNMDNLLVGRYLGPAALAFYSISYRTMMVPIQGFTFAAGRVTLPVFSRMQGDPRRFREAFLDTVQVLAAVTMPLMALSAVSAPIAIPLVLGDRWEPAVVPFQILAVVGTLQGVTSAFAPALIAAGRADAALRAQLVNAVVSVGAFAIGLQWGIEGVAAAYTIAGVLLSTPYSLFVVGGVLEVRIARMVAVLVPPLLSALALAGVWLVADELLDEFGASGIVTLALASPLAILAYLSVFGAIWPERAAHVAYHARLLAGRAA